DVHELADVLDRRAHRLTRGEVHRWVHPVADTGGRSRRDDVTGAQREDATHVGDDLGGWEHQVGRPRLLARGAVDLAAHEEVGRDAAELVWRDEHRAERRAPFEGLAL